MFHRVTVIAGKRGYDHEFGTAKMPLGLWRLGSRAAGCSMLLALASCSSETTTQPSSVLPCTGPVSLSVGTGTTPTFTWTPACTVWVLLVEEQRGLDTWVVFAQPQGIAPGLRYGTVPAGAVEYSPAIPLQTAATYRVGVFRGTPGEDPQLWSDAEEASRFIGTATFTP